jgi:hypothetical protein
MMAAVLRVCSVGVLVALLAGCPEGPRFVNGTVVRTAPQPAPPHFDAAHLTHRVSPDGRYIFSPRQSLEAKALAFVRMEDRSRRVVQGAPIPQYLAFWPNGGGFYAAYTSPDRYSFNAASFFSYDLERREVVSRRDVLLEGSLEAFVPRGDRLLWITGNKLNFFDAQLRTLAAPVTLRSSGDRIDASGSKILVTYNVPASIEVRDWSDGSLTCDFALPRLAPDGASGIVGHYDHFALYAARFLEPNGGDGFIVIDTTSCKQAYSTKGVVRQVNGPLVTAMLEGSLSTTDLRTMSTRTMPIDPSEVLSVSGSGAKGVLWSHPQNTLRIVDFTTNQAVSVDATGLRDVPGDRFLMAPDAPVALWIGPAGVARLDLETAKLSIAVAPWKEPSSYSHFFVPKSPWLYFEDVDGAILLHRDTLKSERLSLTR